jgi:hypothetical protein
MLQKISPHPSLSKRGNSSFCKGRKRGIENYSNQDLLSPRRERIEMRGNERLIN